MSQKPSHPPVGYVVERFPALADTSLLDELLALEARGLPLHVFSLEPPDAPHFHHELPRLGALVTYVPGVLSLPAVLRYNRALARTHRWRHFWTVTRTLLQGRPRRLWRCLQAGYVAYQAERMGLEHLHARLAGDPATVARFASRMSRIPYSLLADSHDIYRNGTSEKDLAGKIRDARFVTTVSDTNVNHLAGLAPEHAGKIRKVHPGIDLERFTVAGTPSGAPFRMVCVASLVEKKGILVLIKACRRLLERGCREYQIDLVGSGPLYAHAQNVIRGSGLQNHVRLVGPKRHREVSLWLQNANCFVLPCVVGADGDRDVLPVAIIEALACGLPVVTTTVGGIPEVVKDGVNGLLVAPDDPDGLADRIESLIRDPGLYERLRTRARDSVAPRFSRERTAASLHEILEWAAAGRPDPRRLGGWWNAAFARWTGKGETVTEMPGVPPRFRSGSSR